MDLGTSPSLRRLRGIVVGVVAVLVATGVLLPFRDDVASKQTVQRLIAELDYAPIDLGSLDEGGRMQQPGGPLAGPDLLVNQ